MICMHRYRVDLECKPNSYTVYRLQSTHCTPYDVCIIVQIKNGTGHGRSLLYATLLYKRTEFGMEKKQCQEIE